MSASCPPCHHLHPTGKRCGSPALQQAQLALGLAPLDPLVDPVSPTPRRTKNVRSPSLIPLETSLIWCIPGGRGYRPQLATSN
jgi:hypothetical protein